MPSTLLSKRSEPRHLDANPRPQSLAEEAISRELARIAAERFREEVARGVDEHNAYLAEYGSLADAVRAMADDTGRG